MASPAATAQTAEEADRVEIVMPLTPGQLKGLSEDLEQLAKRLDLPTWASNTELIIEAVRRQAQAE